MCRAGTPRYTFSYLNGIILFLFKVEGLHWICLWRCCAQYFVPQTFQDGLLVVFFACSKGNVCNLSNWFVFCFYRDQYRQINKDLSVPYIVMHALKMSCISVSTNGNHKEESISLKCHPAFSSLSFSLACFASSSLSEGTSINWYPLGSWLRLYSRSDATGILTNCISYLQRAIATACKESLPVYTCCMFHYGGWKQEWEKTNGVHNRKMLSYVFVSML